MDRSKMAKAASMAIAYANVNKPDLAAFYAEVWLNELGLLRRGDPNSLLSNANREHARGVLVAKGKWTGEKEQAA